MEKSSQKEVDKQEWLDLADQAFFRLKELVDIASVNDPKLLPAIKEVFDRAYGKPRESMELSGKDGATIQPIVIQVIRPPEALDDATPTHTIDGYSQAV